MRLATGVQHETDAAAVQLHVVGAHAGAGRAARGEADRAHLAADRVEQLATERIVQVHRRGAQARPVEQPRLGRAIAGHVAVVVQVIAGEVGEHAHVEMHAIHAALVERVRGHFHRHRLRAFVAQFGEQRMHAQHQRRGETGRHDLRPETGAERAHRTGLLPAQGPRLRQQLHGRGLAVGAGHPDRGHRRAGMAVEAVGHRAHARTQAGDRDRIRRSWQGFGRGRLEQDRRGAGLARGIDEVQAMRAEAGDGDEGIARPHFAAVHHQAGDGQVGRQAFEFRQQFAEQHRARHCSAPAAAVAASATACTGTA